MNRTDRIYDNPSRRRKTNRYFIIKTTSTGGAAHIGTFHKYYYWRAEIRVSHAGVIRFSLPAAATPPQRGILLFLFRPYSLVLPHRAITTLPLLYIGCSTFLSLFLLVFLTRCPDFAAPFLFPSHNRRVIPPSHRSLVPLFFAPWNRLSLRRTCSHSSRTIERKRGRKRYFSRTARTSASAVNSGRPDRGEKFAKYRSNASPASLGGGRSDHRINRTVIGHPHQVNCNLRMLFRELIFSGFSIIFPRR